MEEQGCGWAFMVVLAAVGVWYYWNSPPILAIRYDTQAKKVFVDPKPHNCEWGTAPLGEKHCSYEAIVTKSEDGSVYLTWEKKGN